jgi:hypothetical protein
VQCENARPLWRLAGASDRLDHIAQRQHGGTGLGLAISKELVSLMGGEIGFTSVIAENLTYLGDLSLKQGRRQQARAYYQESLRHWRELDEESLTIYTEPGRLYAVADGLIARGLDVELAVERVAFVHRPGVVATAPAQDRDQVG